jgi:hypothetical protein
LTADRAAPPGPLFSPRRQSSSPSTTACLRATAYRLGLSRRRCGTGSSGPVGRSARREASGDRRGLTDPRRGHEGRQADAQELGQTQDRAAREGSRGAARSGAYGARGG